ncbi:dephospho-CoA kinase [Gracilibacillus kekensis]|uniref:Dephospho-CoA kinase n=1 Tax=Gracilibacillus kekensis TaxID=1027249 RepID=A0A1M7NQG8_9BACI|nr:dephospho-CoA kinase [Gracilibacillus kekensis]SHN06203.1 dephospho-CoA kinase [Gracilibacillus kekensis]
MIIGLTGNIATGKSTISSMIQEEYSIPVIDADMIAREVVEPGEKALQRIVETFGEDILLEDGTLNRKRLGEIIFEDKTKREQLNAIVHPAVRERMEQKKQKFIQLGHELIVLDIPLLFENELTYLVDKTIVVYTTEKIQLKRLMERNQFSEKEAQNRMDAQMDIDKKCAKADAVIDNSGTIASSREQLDSLIKKWKLISKV